jgi:CheY-like chemotaxis protein
MTKILIVEDDPGVSQLYHRIFSLEGYTVELAADGEEGLIKVKNFHPGLILLDISMPKMNGIQVLEVLKASDDTKTIPVVMLTNLSGDEFAQAALAKGAIKYITKSDYEPVQIVDAIKQVISNLPTHTANS